MSSYTTICGSEVTQEYRHTHRGFLFFPKKKLLINCIWKNGSTSFLYEDHLNEILDDEPIEIIKTENFQKFWPYEIPKDVKIVNILRDPVSRFISAYTAEYASLHRRGLLINLDNVFQRLGVGKDVHFSPQFFSVLVEDLEVPVEFKGLNWFETFNGMSIAHQLQSYDHWEDCYQSFYELNKDRYAESYEEQDWWMIRPHDTDTNIVIEVFNRYGIKYDWETVKELYKQSQGGFLRANRVSSKENLLALEYPDIRVFYNKIVKAYHMDYKLIGNVKVIN
jgi:hypothetical protein